MGEWLSFRVMGRISGQAIGCLTIRNFRRASASRGWRRWVVTRGQDRHAVPELFDEVARQKLRLSGFAPGQECVSVPLKISTELEMNSYKPKWR